ncbi:hypothetical protein H8356DRAFT_610764 [Neocallimastix lanati (nom. inval.)]|jgi:hypothetical protein|uniref:Uncharacterized protein n=1 Tax=Neocallimastix californiae TaxID=1754190 RepID=A0A1Y1Z9X7_9FUNG|nr:hypothetical protein H8356DRAFT_610764 [Neocallimastix sp. JGI-2020a]ORY07059.1 hypothetical protein LY90DRAFT_678313 [Neocallimastix californiae]|eukprot:ORY07059.1 hypothetical protein LY90DRAFT_678313 [Neocallimastix californiae]
MGCGASKVTNQTISPIENKIPNEVTSKAISNNVLTSSSSESQKISENSNTDNLVTPINIKTSKNESSKDSASPQTTSSSISNEQEVPHIIKKSSSATMNMEKAKSKSLLKSKSSLLEPVNKKNENIENEKENQQNGSSNNDASSPYLKNNLLNNSFEDEKKRLSQSSSEATLTNQNSSDNIGKLSLTSSFAPLPAIETKTTLRSISFEIPLDDSMICKTIRPSFKGSLPKLHISQDEIKRKIGNVDSKWRDINVTKNGYKKKGPVDEEKLKALKKRLLEKEAEAALNRQRELDKLKAKLEKAQKHALKVQERKRKLEAEWMSKSKSNLEMSSNIDYIS